MKTALITGVSRSFGRQMAEKLLDEGFRVLGCSRTPPEGLIGHERFYWSAIDLSQVRSVESLMRQLLVEHGRIEFELVFLNAGTFGPSPRPAIEVSRGEFGDVLNLNLMANKVLLDLLLKEHRIRYCVISASTVSASARTGLLSYTVSKVALNSLASVYSSEHPATFFAVLGLPATDATPSPDASPAETLAVKDASLWGRIRDQRNDLSTAALVVDVWSLYQGGLEQRMKSGVFQDIRGLILKREIETSVESDPQVHGLPISA